VSCCPLVPQSPRISTGRNGPGSDRSLKGVPIYAAPCKVSATTRSREPAEDREAAGRMSHGHGFSAPAHSWVTLGCGCPHPLHANSAPSTPGACSCWEASPQPKGSTYSFLSPRLECHPQTHSPHFKICQIILVTSVICGPTKSSFLPQENLHACFASDLSSLYPVTSLPPHGRLQDSITAP
jgi:hypothetical protein